MTTSSSGRITIALSAALLLACGGEVDEARSSTDVLPSGLYEMGPITASCDANARLQSERSGAAPPGSLDPAGSFRVVRNGTSANVPLPMRRPSTNPQVWFIGRQTLELDTPRREGTTSGDDDDARCPSGQIHEVIEITKLTSTGVSVRRTEQMSGCALERLSSCTTEFELTLKARD